MTAAHGTDHWLHTLMKQMDAIKFAAEFNSNQGPGSKKFKTRFYQSLFASQEHLRQTFFARSPEEIANLIKTRHNSEYSKWKRQNETKVTARNRLLALYMMVSPRLPLVSV